MVSGRSTSKSEGDGTIPAKSKEILSLDIPPLPLVASNVASSNRLNYMNLTVLTALSSNVVHAAVDSNVAHGATFNENDVIIAVMGAGKSSFVNAAVGSDKAEAIVGHSLISQTGTVRSVRCRHPDGHRSIVLVDTPAGSNHTHLADGQVLKTIANWLKDTYQKNIKLTGILYLHSISDVTMSRTCQKNLKVFKGLCGDENMKNIILVTTTWDLEDASVAFQREEELCSKFWEDMIHLGSQTCRYWGTHASAWKIIEQLNLEGPLHTRQPLQIQREMVDHRMQLWETAVGGILSRTLRTELKIFLGRILRKTRTSPSVQSPERRPRRVSSASESSWSMCTSSNSSYHTPAPFSPAESTGLGCSAHGHRDTLVAMIQGLSLAHQMADIAAAPTLQGAIGTALQIAKTIQGMGGVHHMIGDVVEHSGCLLEGIAQFMGSGLSKDTKKALSSFQKKLKSLQNIVKKMSTRNTASRYFLHDADIQVITSCTTAIRAIYDKPEVTIAMKNLEAIARLEAQAPLRQCECGRFSGQPFTSQPL